MRFEDPIYLYILFVIPAMVVFHYLMEILQKRRMKRFGSTDITAQLINTSLSSLRIKREIKFWLLMLALACMILMFARPQILGAAQQRTDNRQGIEMMVCVDVSNSMLAEDVSPSRMDKCKMMLEDLIDRFDNDKIGLIVFAGDAFIQLPLTADYVSAKMFLQNINPGMIQSQGTDIARAIEIASNSFSQQKGIGRAIVVITDGEDHEGGAEDAAKSASKKGIKTYVLGVGSTKGVPIPFDKGYMTDQSGQTVMTSLNESMCKQLAQAGKGKYIHVDNTTLAQERLAQAMSSLARQEIETSIYTERSEQFQSFALIALILLIIEIIIQEKRLLFRRISLFSKSGVNKIAILIFFLMSASAVFAQTDRGYVRRGNRDYRAEKYAKAETNYRKALEKNADNAQANYNLGNALLFQGKDSLAVVQYNKALQTEQDPMRQAQIYHNIGVVMQSQKDFGQAIEAYKQSLRRNPTDNETRYNLVLCQKQQKDDKNKDQNKNQNKNNDKNKDQDKNKDKDKDKDNNKDKQDKKDNQDKNKDQQPPQNQPQQPKEGEMSKENAEQLLNAAMQQEKATQDKLKKVRGSSRRLQKNW